MSVNLEEFTLAGLYELVTAPATAGPNSITIVIRTQKTPNKASLDLKAPKLLYNLGRFVANHSGRITKHS